MFLYFRGPFPINKLLKRFQFRKKKKKKKNFYIHLNDYKLSFPLSRFASHFNFYQLSCKDPSTIFTLSLLSVNLIKTPLFFFLSGEEVWRTEVPRYLFWSVTRDLFSEVHIRTDTGRRLEVVRDVEGILT